MHLMFIVYFIFIFYKIYKMDKYVKYINIIFIGDYIIFYVYIQSFFLLCFIYK